MQAERPWGYTKLRHFRTSKIQMFDSFKVVCLYLQLPQYLMVQTKRHFNGTTGRMNRILSSKSGIQH